MERTCNNIKELLVVMYLRKNPNQRKLQFLLFHSLFTTVIGHNKRKRVQVQLIEANEP